MRPITVLSALAVVAVLFVPAALAEDVEPKIQAAIDARLKEMAGFAGSKALIDAVKAQNAHQSQTVQEMTQTRWESLQIIDPVVRAFTQNEVGRLLKSRKDEIISEAFVSDASGRKVAFLAKTTWFCHRGMPKHDVPMTGKTWQGPIEVDASSGVRQVQIALPILDGDNPIGSLVVGLNVSKLSHDD